MGARLDILNQRFGRLTTLRKGRSVNAVTHWVCKCDCGAIVEVSTRALIHGHTKSCGCLRKESFQKVRSKGKTFVDLTGQRFGRLLVIKHIGSDEQKRAVFLCRCDCGVEKAIRSHNLKYGFTKSCGCLRKDKFEKAKTDWRQNNG